LLPDFLFFRRLDEVATIGQVLALRAGVELELRALLAEVVEVAIGLDAAPLDLRQKGEGVVFEALDQTLHRARRRFGEQRVGDVWRLWSRISGGQVLATNTSTP
jgi:hypothetical protein